MYDLISVFFIFVGLCYFLPCRRKSGYSRHELDAEFRDDQPRSRESYSRSILAVMGINERRWDQAAHQRRREQACDVILTDNPPSYFSLDLPPSYSAAILGPPAGASIFSCGAAAQTSSRRPGGGWEEVNENLCVGAGRFPYPPPLPEEPGVGDDDVAGRSGGRAALSPVGRVLNVSRVTPLGTRRLITSPPPAYDDVITGNA